MSQLLYPQERDQVPIVQEAGWASGPVWMGMENLASVGCPHTVRPVTNCYTGCIIRTHSGVLKVTERRRVKHFPGTESVAAVW